MLAHELFKAGMVDGRQVEIGWICLIIKRKIDAVGMLLLDDFIIVVLLLRFARFIRVFDFKSQPFFRFRVKLASIAIR